MFVLFEQSSNFFLVFLTFCCLKFYMPRSFSKWRTIKTNWPWTFQMKFWYFYFCLLMTWLRFLLHVNCFITCQGRISCLLRNLMISRNCLTIGGSYMIFFWYVSLFFQSNCLFACLFVWKILILMKRTYIWQRMSY